MLALSAVPSVAIGAGGMNHFGFILVSNEDIDDAVLQVLATGGKLIKRTTSQQGGLVEDNAYVTDPDGYVIELSAQPLLLSRKRSQA